MKNEAESVPMTMRDKSILVICWTACIFAGAAAWASTGEATWAAAPGLGILVAASAGVLLLLPVSLALLRLPGSPGGLAWRITRAFHRRQSLALLLLGQVAVQVSYLLGRQVLAELLLPLTVILAALTCIWSCVGRKDHVASALLPSVLWLAALVCARLGFERASGAIDPLAAAPSGALVYGFYAAALCVLALAPWVMLFEPLAQRALDWLHRKGGLARLGFVASLAVTVGLLGLTQVAGGADVRLDLILRAAVLTSFALLAWASLSPTEPSRDRSREAGLTIRRDMPAWLYWIGAGLIGGLYLVVSGFVHAPGQLNPDGLAYLTIARSISAGDFVVRGYWSPLMSWLLAPAIAVGADPYAAFQVLVRGCGLAWMILAVALARRAGVTLAGQLALALVLALVALTRTFYPVTPDLLAAVLFAAYLLLVSRPSFTGRPLLDGASAGLLGAAAAYAKFYNFPFVIAHICTLSLLLWARRNRDARVLRTLAMALITFFLASIPNAIAIADRYGSPAFTTSTRVAHASLGPTAPGLHPCWASRLCAEPDDVLFPWEDPVAGYYPDAGWSPFQSLDLLRHQIRLAWSNAGALFSEALGEVGPLPALALGMLALAAAAAWRGSRGEPLALAGLLTVALHSSGYVLTSSVDFRYQLAILPVLWIVYFRAIESGEMSGLLPGSMARAASAARVLLIVLPVVSFSGWHRCAPRSIPIAWTASNGTRSS